MLTFPNVSIFSAYSVNEKLLGDQSLSSIAEEFQKQAIALARDSTDAKPDVEILVEPIDWFSGVGHRFLRLGVNHRVAGTEMYTSGKLYGIDISSAAAVVALGVSSGNHILDLCCAPGAKLAMISDTLAMQEYVEHEESEQEVDEKAQEPSQSGVLVGSVSGVDISSSRLSACRTVCQKYELANVRLFLDDACEFNTLAPPPRLSSDEKAPSSLNNKSIPPPVFPTDVSQTLPEEMTTVPQVPKHTRRALRQRHAAVLDKLLFTSDWKLCSVASQLYDRVILDAQCTLDASIRHLLKHNKCGWIDFEGDPTTTVSALQKKMIYNAYRLLAPGGTLVYATCSFCNAQNEDVVQWLLSHEPQTAKVVKIDWPAEFLPFVSPGHIEHTVRFYPKHSGTSGMFIAKMTKLALEETTEIK